MDLVVFLSCLVGFVIVVAIGVYLFEKYGHITGPDGKPYDINAPWSVEQNNSTE